MMDYSKLGITPISEESGAGEDVKYDEEFEKVEAELSKLTSPTVSSEIEWSLVVTLCENILEHKSKNLLVAVYLSFALFKVRGIEGFSDGVKVLADMLENYWESMYPPLRRMKGRRNAIEWMLEKISKEIESSEAIEVEVSKKEDFLQDLKRIDDFLNEKIEDAPLFYNLIKLIDMKLDVVNSSVEEETLEEMGDEKEVREQEVEQPQEIEDEEPEPSEPTPEVQEIQESEEVHLEEVHSSEEVKTTDARDVVVEKKKEFQRDETLDVELQEVVSNLNVTLGKMIESHDYRSELFIINRASIWLDVESLPANENGKTLLPPPDSMDIEILEKLYKNEEYEALIWAAESRITTYIFWLDLHFYVAFSLKKLAYKEEAQTILEQSRYLLRKLPNLEKLSFSNSMPFAHKMTQKWLGSRDSLASQVENPSVQKVEVECSVEGIDKLCQLMQRSASKEEELSYNIELCRCLADSENRLLIETYTQKLLNMLEEFHIDRWNPEIALRSYLVIIDSLRSMDDAKSEALVSLLQSKVALLRPSLVSL